MTRIWVFCLLALPVLHAYTDETTSDGSKCVIPPDPPHGHFVVDSPDVSAALEENIFALNVSCDPGYRISGNGDISCYLGYWTVEEFPTCVEEEIKQNQMESADRTDSSLENPMLNGSCRIEQSQSVQYRCITTESGVEGTRDCQELEPDGTAIQPECRQPNYYSPTDLSRMYCKKGRWNYLPKCIPECGTLTPKGVPLVVDGRIAERGEIPWQVAIYIKRKKIPEQICGGSLISDKIVLSAAHCFWYEQKMRALPASLYAVAVGKLYRDWNDPRDVIYSQKSDVKNLYLSSFFFGVELNFQHDMAVMIVKNPFVYRFFVRPVCLDFNEDFNRRQLQRGNLGKVAGWGLTTGRKGSESPILKELDLPYVPYDECVSRTPSAFVEFINGEKICAGYQNGSTVCKGDSGGGLAFPEVVHGKTRYYLRGVVSTSPVTLDSTTQCSLETLTSFEPVLKHEKLIKSHWVSDLDNFINPASRLTVPQWQCGDETAIDFHLQCDGVLDCPDGSDETFALCKTAHCQKNWFKCTYGACVDGTAPCNGVQDCADNSDELLPRCRNETEEVRNQFKCKNGQMIPAGNHCNGAADCTDGSDETLETCAAKTCSRHQLRCNYGACVNGGVECNGKEDCVGGYDESDELCTKIEKHQHDLAHSVIPTQGGKCKLPPYPRHGTYAVTNNPAAAPGQVYPSALLTISCDPGMGVEDNAYSMWCDNGIWSNAMPECVRFCRLHADPSVEYQCVSPSVDSGLRECGPLVPVGAVVRPVCRSPEYYYPGVLSNMHCIDGRWDYIALCNPECGRVDSSAIQNPEQPSMEGRAALKGEMPWYTVIYVDTEMMGLKRPVSSGSLISTKAVISGAGGYYSGSDGLPGMRKFVYTAEVGKLFQAWNSAKDVDAQVSTVAEIYTPPDYREKVSNYQDDIAVLIVATPFKYTAFVRPVCLNFDPDFDKHQLKPGTLGKVAGYGINKEWQSLQVADLPILTDDQCRDLSPLQFRILKTYDKVCAGYPNRTILCGDDDGAGLVVPARELAVERYYLRGVVSYRSGYGKSEYCYSGGPVLLTQITKHEDFIKQFK